MVAVGHRDMRHGVNAQLSEAKLGSREFGTLQILGSLAERRPAQIEAKRTSGMKRTGTGTGTGTGTREERNRAA